MSDDEEEEWGAAEGSVSGVDDIHSAASLLISQIKEMKAVHSLNQQLVGLTPFTTCDLADDVHWWACSIVKGEGETQEGFGPAFKQSRYRARDR